MAKKRFMIVMESRKGYVVEAKDQEEAEDIVLNTPSEALITTSRTKVVYVGEEAGSESV